MAKKQKPTKFLIETSAVRAVLGKSTAAHCKHVSAVTAGGEYWTSVYIRMEFIRLWVCCMARMAFEISQSTDVADAFYRLEQDFSIRKIKGYLASIASYLKQTGAFSNSRAAAEEIASLAIAWLKEFDVVFRSSINNNCKCQIGNRKLDVDYNLLMTELHDFYQAFVKPVTDCDVNDFLQMSRPNGRIAKLLKDPSVAKLTVGKNLAKLKSLDKWVTCKECAWIGDAVIALEQPGSVNLVHTDASFDELCRVQGTPHTPVMSVTACNKLSSVNDAASKDETTDSG